MTFQRQVAFWVGALIVLVLLLWLLSGVLLPFVAGMALAYLLDPVADRLERIGVSRLIATLMILAAFIVIFVIAMMLVVPLLADQLGQLIARLPDYALRLQQLISEPGQEWLREFLGSSLDNVRGSIGQVVGQGASWLTAFLTQVWAGGQALMSIVSLLVVTPVVAFYLLVDWDRMVSSVDRAIPRQYLGEVRTIAADIDGAVSGFIRGQALVCLFLGVFYAVGLTMVGLNFGLLIGLGAGFLSFIPYVGSLTGLVMSAGVALAQFAPDWISVGLVLGVFFVGQFLEGNILQPKLVGRSVGLHPVWLMFALFAFGSLMGFVGLLLAVPLAAAIGVLARYALGRYMNSPLYAGLPGQKKRDRDLPPAA